MNRGDVHDHAVRRLQRPAADVALEVLLLLMRVERVPIVELLVAVVAPENVRGGHAPPFLLAHCPGGKADKSKNLTGLFFLNRHENPN